MKKHTIKKLFLAFSAFLMLFYSVFSVLVFASFFLRFDVSSSSNGGVHYIVYSVNGSSVDGVSGTSYVVEFGSDVSIGTVISFRSYDNSPRLFYYDPSFSTDPSNPSRISFSDSELYFSLNMTSTSSQSVQNYFIIVDSVTSTPTPTPTPMPQVATPTPDSEATAIPFPTSTTYPQASPLTSDTDFWERMGQNANGAWGVITSTVSGIFSNVVMRNLAIYIPLFGLIVGLIIYTITLGGGDDN